MAILRERTAAQHANLADRHRWAVANTLSWADEAAARGDYADALAWLDTITAIGDQLSPEYLAKRRSWRHKAAATMGATSPTARPAAAPPQATRRSGNPIPAETTKRLADAA